MWGKMLHSQKFTRILIIMLLVAFLLATVNVAYAANNRAPQAAASCCSGYPPCSYWIKGCGWCCLGNISITGAMKLKYDANCNLTIAATRCLLPCGWGGCSH